MALRQDPAGVAAAAIGSLRRSDSNGTGIRRRRCGRGFAYLGPDAATVKDRRTLARIKAPAVARASYIDPRVIDLYQDGYTIASVLGELGKDSDFGDLATRGRAEKAVLDLLASA